MTETISLKSRDGDVIKTSMKCALMCLTIKNMQESISFEKDTEIPLDVIDTATLKRIVRWLEKWQDDPQPTLEEINNKTADTIDGWNQTFLKEMQLDELYDLINATNFLGIPGLLWLGTREIAYMIKGKTAEEIRETFNIVNDWSAEDFELILRENQWCEER